MWDVFISYASEDNDQVASPLAEELRRRGLTVWYDKFSLSLGDSLRQTIDEGLMQSRFGVVVLSRSFFAKEWPQRELSGLIARETSMGKVILPILHDVSYEELAEYSPILADRLGIKSEKGISALADAIEDAIRSKAHLSESVRDATQPAAGSTSIANITASHLRVKPRRRGKGLSGMAAAAWGLVQARAVPPLVVLWLQWILAVFLLYVNSYYMGLLGFLGPLWLVPLSYLAARFIARSTGMASIVGGFAGGLIGAAISLSVREWGAKYGLVFGAYFGAVFSAYFSAPDRQVKIAWAFLSTLLMVGLELLHYPDSYRYIPNYAFSGAASSVLLGFVFVLLAELVKRFQGEEVGQDDSADGEDTFPSS